MILKKYDQKLILEKKICLFHGKNEGQKEIILKIKKNLITISNNMKKI